MTPTTTSNPFQEPGLFTDTSNPSSPAFMKQNGFKWIVQQTQNSNNPLKPMHLEAYKAEGFLIGAWGVSYHQSDLRRDMTALVGSAPDADMYVMNAERPIDPIPLISQGELTDKPKALITLVGMLNDVGAKQLVAAGWQIIGEMYMNDQPNLTAKECEWQRQNAGIPVDRYSHSLGMYYGLQGWVTGAEYSLSLKEAGSGRRFSCWMVEHGSESSYSELRAQGISDNPAPPVPPAEKTLAQYRDEALAVLDEAVDVHGAKVTDTTRVSHMRRVGRTSEVQRKKVDPLLDSIGA